MIRHDTLIKHLYTHYFIFAFFITNINLIFSQSVIYNEEFSFHNYSNSDQTELQLIEIDSNSFFACWTSYGQDGSGHGIIAQKFSNDGSKIGEEFIVNSFSDSTQTQPRMLKLDNNTFVICYASYITNTYRICFQLFDYNGNKIGDEVIIGNQYYGWKPEILKLNNGSFAITWDGTDIYAQIFGIDGIKISEPFAVNTTSGYSLNPLIYAVNSDKFLIYWKLGEGYYGQILDTEGTKVGSEFKMSTAGTSSIGYFPQILRLENGNSVFCWESGNIYIQRYDNNFNQLGDFVVVSDYGNTKSPQLLSLSDGTIVVSWWNTSFSHIFFQKFDANLTRIGGNNKVSNSANSDNRWPKLARLSDEQFIISWISYDDYYRNNGKVYSQLFYNDGSRFGKVFIVNTIIDDAELDYTKFFNINDNTFIIAWQRLLQNASRWDILGKIYLNTPIVHDLIEYYLIEPPDGASIDEKDIFLKWEYPSGIHINFPWEIEYDLHISEDSLFQQPQIITGITDTIYQIDALTVGKTYFWKVIAKNIEGDSLWSSNINSFYRDEFPTNINKLESTLPKSFELYQNYPNPFNPSTVISYSIPHNGAVKLKVYNILGKEISTLVDEVQNPGTYKVKFDGSNLSSSIYLYRLETEGYSKVRKMVLLR